MVLNKRKPVNLIPEPTNIPDLADVFVMKGTNEVFTDYEKYLKRFDWLNQKKFTDGVNGKSGLTYWDAQESESKSSAAVENVFPEVLRDPILRKVQFSTISRMDELVNKIFDEFKHDFFPGEEVFVHLGEGTEAFKGVIREKAKFPMIRGADGSIQREPFSRYFVRLDNNDAEEALLDDNHIRRDKKVFTKQNLRSFLKNSLQREAWTGAPWLVKEQLAIQYRLPMEIPAHLLQEARILQNKQQALSMRQAKGKKKNGMTPQEVAHMQQEHARMQQMQQQLPGAPPQPQYQQRMEPPRPVPPPIKYPIEDLDVQPKRNGVSRPKLEFWTAEMADYITNNRKTSFTDITMESMGLLLEVWNTLNVQCEVYILDSFIFDDFVDAMGYHGIEPSCQLFEEAHCAVLKQFVDDKGVLQIKDMPKKIEEVPDEDSEMQDESEASTPLPDAPARSTRSRLSHVENAADITQSPSTERQNRAAELFLERSWEARCAARDFENGGWQVIVVGVLHQLSGSPSYKERCDKILAHLVPADAEPTQETVLEQYASMDINLRINALQILVLLSIRTDAIKNFLDTCSDDMTDVRKRKIEHQREKKSLLEALQAKDRERKILLPDNMPKSPEPEPMDVDTTGVTEEVSEVDGAGSTDGDEDEPKGGRSLRRGGNDRKRKREEEAARKEKEAKEKAEAIKAQNKQTKEFKKILGEIEDLQNQIKDHEEKIVECDSDLREANVQRTRVLGKDRFCNRYYWFERNGQPFGGLPSSSTADYGYANGRIWVQGPDDMEREGFIDRTPEEQKFYQQQFSMTVHERRKMEEGPTILNNAQEWGFYDDPDRLDNLIGWLDDRGEREKKLRKELQEWREKISQYMLAHKKFKDEEAAKKMEVEEESTTRVSTRHKVHEQSAAKERCLKWENSMALNDLGHLHSEPPKKKPNKKKAADPVVQQKGIAVVLGRNGKPLSRQGSDYSFRR